MRLFFSILSVGYVLAIFLLADSPVVSDLSSFNPYSLLHIPLYAILTVLLIFSIIPIRMRRGAPMAPGGRSLLSNRDPRPDTQSSKLFIPAFIAMGVAVADEIHQVSVPNRNGSVGDVLLDLMGIALVMFVAYLRLRRPYSEPL